MLKPGDWVIIANGQERIIGFIRDFSRLRNEVYIVQVSKYLDKRITAIKPVLEVVETKKVMAVGLTLAKEDWDAMIDLPIRGKSRYTLLIQLFRTNDPKMLGCARSTGRFHSGINDNFRKNGRD
ncbi:hypothetical protein [Domibacillus indicus]|uniref:hypothetical protein n=1 Tax=Domibacillus indicus TaxID=1437523 RepID=UPI0012E02D51|nr:hypothetical protein [Domibacillus indicus]